MELKPRRIVIADGRTTVSRPRRVDIATQPGTSYFELWSATDVPRLPHDGSDPAAARGPLRPLRGGNVFRIARLPPVNELGSVEDDPDQVERIVGEYESAFDVTIEDPEDHASDAVIYTVVLAGEAVVTIGDESVRVRPGDTVVNLGDDTHWHNRGPEPCYLASVAIAATRTSDDKLR